MFALPDLPYAYNALEPFIDELTMKIHHDKHHAAYLKNLNDALAENEAISSKPIEEILHHLSEIPEALRTKVRNNGGGYYNHILFWENMAPPPKGSMPKPSGRLLASLEKTFGSFEQFQEKFSAAAMGRFGSGWAWLVKDQDSLSIIDTANQDSPVSDGKPPILCLDVWEHAYYLKYQNKRADYIKAWWNVVNWTAAERRFT